MELVLEQVALEMEETFNKKTINQKMKKQFLVVSMFAALMLVTSCSKDDSEKNIELQPINTEVVNDGNQAVVEKTYPITVKASKKKSVSKISLGDNETDENFESDDKLVLTWGEDGSVELDLTDGAGSTSATFSGEIPESANGQSVTAHIGTPITSTSTLGYTSLADAVHNCCYLVSNTSFTYTAGEDIEPLTLDDQNSYLHFKLSETQTKFDLNIDGNTFTFSDFSNHEIWIAVPCGKTIKGNMISIGGKELESAKVYTVDRTDVVDLGFENHTLWKISNEGDNVTYANISIPDGYRLPNKTELSTFIGMTYSIQNNAFSFTTDYGSISFPLMGFMESSGVVRQLNQVGYYWSSEIDGNKASDLVFITKYKSSETERVTIDSHPKELGFSVRAVRFMN